LVAELNGFREEGRTGVALVRYNMLSDEHHGVATVPQKAHDAKAPRQQRAHRRSPLHDGVGHLYNHLLHIYRLPRPALGRHGIGLRRISGLYEQSQQR
jgi:hypothetical protein